MGAGGMRTGWLTNDILTAIPGTKTLWHDLLSWLPGLQWVGYDYNRLADAVDRELGRGRPDYIIRNATWVRPFAAGVPTIALLQDIMPEDSPARTMQVEVCPGAALTVFNSQYTRSRYPELADCRSVIIPLPVDFDRFQPDQLAPKSFDVCWVGARTNVKGYDRLVSLIRAMPELKWLVVLKEQTVPPEYPNVTFRSMVGHADLPEVYSSARIGLCTSREETQHLAGIEMAGCGLPVVATNVGAYYSDVLGWNGWRATCKPADLAPTIRWVLEHISVGGENRARVRLNVMEAGFTPAACRAAWENAVETVCSQ